MIADFETGIHFIKFGADWCAPCRQLEPVLNTTLPDNVNVDADKTLLWFKDESKTMSQYAFQYFHARNFEDRLEAINEAAENISDTKAQAVLKAALQDSFYVIRVRAIQSYNPTVLDEATENTLLQLASKDPSSEVREQAIDALSGLYNEDYILLK